MREQETIQKSKDPSVITTATGTAHMTEEATVYGCDLDTFAQVQLLKESPVLSLGYLCEENGYSYEWHPGQPSYLIKDVRTSSVPPTTTFLGGPRSASNRTPDQSSGRPEANTSCGRTRSQRGKNIRTASTIHGRIDEVISTSTDVSLADVASDSSFRTSSSKTYVKQSRKKAQVIHSFF